MWLAWAGRKGALIPLVPDVAGGERIITTRTREEALTAICDRLAASGYVRETLTRCNSMTLTPELHRGCTYVLLESRG